MKIEATKPGLYVRVGDRLECIQEIGTTVVIIELNKTEAVMISELLTSMAGC